ncbi:MULTISPECIES: rod shape-determining protein RodA [Aminobacterium]|jgi:rod shape determining protein RodA|uniref:Peptidoglycan glycosyltransferase RodA n=1 Tax=Aminobacterium colombiense (strain DSM 12261 / ALA-1) TaxID=572547 RepID=D5EDW1_AMICL|nr:MULTISPECIES: rod shape-determining protein RodA [Aminobacterium]ADE56743.1 rod shape-determining protein RodA [Aminobacterium colombiense DSM 12261]NLK31045.1 rod shape-determining protein RodA [Aminobacterium colombiense]
MGEKRFSIKEIFAYGDKVLIISVLALFVLGVLSIYSAEMGVGRKASGFAMRQLVWGLISLVVFFVVIKVGYRRLINWAYFIYWVFSVGSLLIVLLTGLTVKGAQSWLNLGLLRFQPSEAGKIGLALVMAKHFCRYPPENLSRFIGGLILAGISTLLVFIQPDLGSSIVYGLMILIALVVAGAPKRYVLTLTGLAFVLLPVGWQFLKEYQKKRLLVFINPALDPLGAGYNVIQSRIAVGSGGLLGKGFLHGLQSKLRFLPEPHTDFIFSVYAEEFGFLGSLIVLVLFCVVFWRIINAGLRCKDKRGKVLVASLAAWIWFQVVESIGMSMGLLPITGLPLPFLSYGGSSLLAVSVAIALVMSVYLSTMKDYE